MIFQPSNRHRSPGESLPHKFRLGMLPNNLNKQALIATLDLLQHDGHSDDFSVSRTRQYSHLPAFTPDALVDALVLKGVSLSQRGNRPSIFRCLITLLLII